MSEAEASYIRGVITPTFEGPNLWESGAVFSYGKLLGRSCRALKVQPQRINNRNVVFSRSGTLIGSFDQVTTTLASHQSRKACTSPPLLHSYLRASAVPALAPGQSWPGLDVRAYVVGEEVVGAVVRLPFYVIGDGASSLEQLHANLMESLERDVFLTPPSVEQLAEFLSEIGGSLDDVPPEGRILPLAAEAGPGAGEAITHDVTRKLKHEAKQLAVDAVWAFPGLVASGVHLRVPDFDEPADAAVVSVDPAMDITEFRYPTYGHGRRISGAIIEQMMRSAGVD